MSAAEGRGLGIRVLCSMAVRHLLTDLAESAQGTRGVRTSPVVVTSVGGVTAREMIATKDCADVAVLADGAIRSLEREGHILPGTVTPLVVSDMVAAVPEDDGASPRPDGTAFADADGLRGALLEARSIGYSTGPSGRALLSMIDGWGLRPALDDRLVQAPAGVPVAELIASGTVSLGFQQRSELTGASGVKVLGALPADCAVKSVFSMGAAARAVDTRAARSLIAEWASPRTGRMRLAHGFELP
ncbi:substrate-binding domain-containing protein [Actinomyces sp. Z5]|uniref:substrate-binding domain-containing protein n=1 Tax=Actinomyces sp. Z5 TaxID=2250216 RepID=UPI001C654AA9|nr:substrate-binding domain-containing protein [Actinomyces sp. Z5]